MEEVNCFFRINRITKKIAIDVIVNLIILATLRSNILKDNAKVLKLILKINIVNIIKIEGKIVSTNII